MCRNRCIGTWTVDVHVRACICIPLCVHSLLCICSEVFKPLSCFQDFLKTLSQSSGLPGTEPSDQPACPHPRGQVTGVLSMPQCTLRACEGWEPECSSCGAAHGQGDASSVLLTLGGGVASVSAGSASTQVSCTQGASRKRRKISV